jgi:hypothetical protein
LFPEENETHENLEKDGNPRLNSFWKRKKKKRREAFSKVPNLCGRRTAFITSAYVVVMGTFNPKHLSFIAAIG